LQALLEVVTKPFEAEQLLDARTRPYPQVTVQTIEQPLDRSGQFCLISM
jgi:hypothetical protein